jgi:hypothetical protein
MIVIRTPAHKQTDPAKAPGQVKSEHTLGEYIAKKYPPEIKHSMSSFDEWFYAYTLKYGLPPAYIVANAAWNAAKGIAE